MDLHINPLAIVVAALVPMIMGFIWYNPKVFGKAWQVAAGVTDEKMKGANMLVVFGVSLLLSFLLASSMLGMTIHQLGVFSTLAGDETIRDPNSELGKWFTEFMAKNGMNFRTFKHGAFHGFLGAMMIAVPILSTNALFERKGFKYIAINCGYWIITMMIMGGIVCGWTN
jgi:hypothetical protein